MAKKTKISKKKLEEKIQEIFLKYRSHEYVTSFLNDIRPVERELERLKTTHTGLKDGMSLFLKECSEIEQLMVKNIYRGLFLELMQLEKKLNSTIKELSETIAINHKYRESVSKTNYLFKMTSQEKRQSQKATTIALYDLSVLLGGTSNLFKYLKTNKKKIPPELRIITSEDALRKRIARYKPVSLKK